MCGPCLCRCPWRCSERPRSPPAYRTRLDALGHGLPTQHEHRRVRAFAVALIPAREVPNHRRTMLHGQREHQLIALAHFVGRQNPRERADRQRLYIAQRSVAMPGQRLRSASRCSASAAFSSRVSSRSAARCPPLNPLREVRALPSALRGPVDCSHGFHARINAACLARRSGVHPLPMLLLQ